MNLSGLLGGLTTTPAPSQFPEKYCTEVDVLTSKDSASLVNFFNLQEEHFIDLKGRRGLNKKHGENHPTGETVWLPVAFNEKGEVTDEKLTSPYSYTQNYSEFQRIIKIALQQLGKELKFENTTQYMGISLFQHELEVENQVPEIEYHIDNSSYAMVVMLDDSSKWQGGNFLFKSHDGLAPLQELKPSQGNAVLFSNRGTMHSLTAMRSNCDVRVQRTVLTLHVEGSPLEELKDYRLKKGFSFTSCLTNFFLFLVHFIQKR